MATSRAPEPTERDIARAAIATARAVFDGSDGRLTVAYYRRLVSLGPLGIVAMNLFRAQKTSTRAKVYRGRHYRAASYEVKNFSLSQLVAALKAVQEITWGWKHDPHTPNFEWILYVDLPTGKQCSFHTCDRLSGPDYSGEWKREHKSEETILEFVDSIAEKTDAC